MLSKEMVLQLFSLMPAILCQQLLAAGPDSSHVTVIPGRDYAASSAWRWLWGAHYRNAWTQPVSIPYLDLRQYAGGLKPVSRGGGNQTRALQLDGADGRQYSFRSIDKDPTKALPPEYQELKAGQYFRKV